MSVTVELPGGDTAELKGSDQLTNKDVKAIRRVARKVGAVGQKLRGLGVDDIGDEDADEADTTRKTLDILSQLTDDEDDTLDLFQRFCLVLRLESWTVKNADGSDRPLPTTVEEVDDLERPLYAILTKAAAELNLNDDFSIEASMDPKAPIEN